MLKYNPDTLANYSTQAYGDYVRSLCQQWMPCFRDETPKTEKTVFDRLQRWIPSLRHVMPKGQHIKHIGNVCKKLRKMLACTLLPSQVANNVTANLLICVDKLFDAESVKRFTDGDRLILSSVVSVLIHPSVTKLDLKNSPPWQIDGRLIDQYVRENLSQLKFLKVLNLGVLYLPEMIDTPSQNLQELTFSGTLLRVPEGLPFAAPKLMAVSVLQQFSNSCHSLHKLKIENSYIDDVGLKFLLKFTQLEDLEFYGIEGFSDKGMTKLLEGLAKNTDATGAALLKSLKYSELTPEQLHFVVHTFHLVSFYVNKPVKDIHYLSHLRSLSISEELPSIKNTLRAVGHQLLHLDLYSFDSVNVCVVADCCPLLVSLKVSSGKDNMLNDSEVSLPSFSKLKIVDIWSSCPKLLTCILTNCTNLKVLKLNISGMKEFNIAEVLLKNPLRDIEELELRASFTDVDIEILQQFQVVHNYFWKSQTFRISDSYRVRLTNAVRLPDS